MVKRSYTEEVIAELQRLRVLLAKQRRHAITLAAAVEDCEINDEILYTHLSQASEAASTGIKKTETLEISWSSLGAYAPMRQYFETAFNDILWSHHNQTIHELMLFQIRLKDAFPQHIERFEHVLSRIDLSIILSNAVSKIFPQTETEEAAELRQLTTELETTREEFSLKVQSLEAEINSLKTQLDEVEQNRAYEMQQVEAVVWHIHHALELMRTAVAAQDSRIAGQIQEHRQGIDNLGLLGLLGYVNLKTGKQNKFR